MSSIWDGIPNATEVDLTQLSEEQRRLLLSEYIDEQKAADLVTQIDGSASDYVTNMERIAKVMGWISSATNGAVKIAKFLT